MDRLPGVFYVRFMDDWVILAESRWKLRRAVRIMNVTLQELVLDQHPEKTFIGRLDRGFDFLGYDFSASAAIAPTGAFSVWPKRSLRFTSRVRACPARSDTQRTGCADCTPVFSLRTSRNHMETHKKNTHGTCLKKSNHRWAWMAGATAAAAAAPHTQAATA